jgi:hypothetical protein
MPLGKLSSRGWLNALALISWPSHRKEKVMEEPLINQKYQLEKFPGKGGWTYVILPEIRQHIKRKFGMVKVKGRIDDYELMGYNLERRKATG